MDTHTIWYGPHACESCGVTIVKAAREHGGAALEPPARLMDAYQNGARSRDVDLVYPMTWTPHLCDPVTVEAWKTQTPATIAPPDTPAVSDRPLSDDPVLP